MASLPLGCGVTLRGPPGWFYNPARLWPIWVADGRPRGGGVRPEWDASLRRHEAQRTAVLIDSQAQVQALCAEARRAGRVAFDTEFVMEDRYEAEVCLIQLATAEGVYLIDPYLKLDITPVWGLLQDPAVETVVHAGQEDLGLCVQHTGQPPRNVLDVQVAAGLAGYDYPISLQRLVQSTRHIRLHKSKTLTDWRRRPLTAEQVQYAAEDVEHLLPIRDLLVAQLEKRHRTAWLREEVAAFEELTLYRRAEEDKLTRLKGSGTLAGQSLVVARELIAWRDDVAREVNRPPRTVLKDYLLVEVARHRLATAEQIRDLRGVNLARRHLESLAERVKHALTLPYEQGRPANAHHEESPEEAAMLALATAVVRVYCHEHGIAYSLAATKKAIQDVLRYRAQANGRPAGKPELLTGWRGRTVGAALDGVLTGRRSLRVERHASGFRVLLEAEKPDG